MREEPTWIQDQNDRAEYEQYQSDMAEMEWKYHHDHEIAEKESGDILVRFIEKHYKDLESIV